MSLEPAPPEVKGSRPYDGSGRRERARRTHDAVLERARARFLEHGYAGTTIESVAGDVGISTATIYKTYGGKPGLVRALCERALAGEGTVPAEERSDALRTSAHDAGALIEGWGRLLAEVSPRVSPILLLLREAAAHDPVADALHRELDGTRLARMSANARHLVDRGHLRAGVGFRDARDVLWLYSSPDIYDLLVRRRGWSVGRYARFVTTAMIGALV